MAAGASRVRRAVPGWELARRTNFADSPSSLKIGATRPAGDFAMRASRRCSAIPPRDRGVIIGAIASPSHCAEWQHHADVARHTLKGEAQR